MNVSDVVNGVNLPSQDRDLRTVDAKLLARISRQDETISAMAEALAVLAAAVETLRDRIGKIEQNL